MDAKIAREVTAERVRRVSQGYTNAKGEVVAGLGGGFRFCELGEPLYDEAGHIRPAVKFAELARHIYFAETGEPLPRERVPNTPLLGVHQGRAVCLLYNGILKDKSPEGGNALTHDSLALLREAATGQAFERMVVYGTSRRLSPARLQREGITFKQIPYTLRTA
jgi:site-specific DNA-methyltransferase (adenine-specific)/adenine-specific DNA-methyltransferase